MAMSGEAQARERRMATEAGVCPRLTAPIPLSAAKTAEGMKWRHKMSGVIVSARLDAGVAGNLRLSTGLAERQDRVEDGGRARYQCSEPGAHPHPP